MWYTFVKTIWWERWKNQELTYWKYDDHQLRQQDLATQQQWWSWNSKFHYSFSKCTFFWSDFILTDFFAYLGPKIVLRIHLFKRHDLKNYRKSQKKKLRRDRTSKTVSLNSVWDSLLKRNEYVERSFHIHVGGTGSGLERCPLISNKWCQLQESTKTRRNWVDMNTSPVWIALI